MTRLYVCFLFLQEEGKTASRSHSRSHSRLHSRSSSCDLRESKYSSMSEEDFEMEAKKRGWVKHKGSSSEATSRGEATSHGCFGDCFGSGRKKEAAPLETVYEESDQNFEFRPRTQLQYEETDYVQRFESTPRTPPYPR